MIEITLPNWLYEEVTSCRVLKISPDYFRIRKAVDRRIYEIARKHCGASADFHISLEKLRKKTGATSPKEKFRFNIKQLSKTNDLPDYSVLYDVDTDIVTLKNRDVEASKKYEESLQNLRQKQNREALANKQQESTQSLHYDIDVQQLEGVEREEAISRLKKQRDEIIAQFSSGK